MSDDKQPVTQASQPATAATAKQDQNVPDWQHALWKHAVDMKAWIRRELAHAASGISEAERAEKNP
jgi:hypothetical protein